MHSIHVSNLEKGLYKSISKLRQDKTPFELRQDLYNAALKHAHDFLKKKQSNLKNGFEERKEFFSSKNAKRYSEIAFVTKPIDTDEVSQIAQILEKNFLPKIQSHINSIGPAVLKLKSNKYIIVIFLAFFPPTVSIRKFLSYFPDLRSVSLPATNFKYLVSLINKFRRMIKFNDFEDLPPSTKRDSYKTMQFYKSSFASQRSTELFCWLFTDCRFIDLITEMWTDFSYSSEKEKSEHTLDLHFYRNEEEYVYQIHLQLPKEGETDLKNNAIFERNIDLNKLLGVDQLNNEDNNNELLSTLNDQNDEFNKPKELVLLNKQEEQIQQEKEQLQQQEEQIKQDELTKQEESLKEAEDKLKQEEERLKQEQQHQQEEELKQQEKEIKQKEELFDQQEKLLKEKEELLVQKEEELKQEEKLQDIEDKLNEQEERLKHEEMVQHEKEARQQEPTTEEQKEPITTEEQLKQQQEHLNEVEEELKQEEERLKQEQEQHQKEEELKQQEERLRQEEDRLKEEQLKQKEEELKQQEERLKQDEEQHKQEEDLKKQEDELKQKEEELRQEEERLKQEEEQHKQEEELRQQEEKLRQEDDRLKEEELKRQEEELKKVEDELKQQEEQFKQQQQQPNQDDNDDLDFLISQLNDDDVNEQQTKPDEEKVIDQNENIVLNEQGNEQKKELSLVDLMNDDDDAISKSLSNESFDNIKDGIISHDSDKNNMPSGSENNLNTADNVYEDEDEVGRGPAAVIIDEANDDNTSSTILLHPVNDDNFKPVDEYSHIVRDGNDSFSSDEEIKIDDNYSPEHNLINSSIAKLASDALLPDGEKQEETTNIATENANEATELAKSPSKNMKLRSTRKASPTIKGMHTKKTSSSNLKTKTAIKTVPKEFNANESVPPPTNE